MRTEYENGVKVRLHAQPPVGLEQGTPSEDAVVVSALENGNYLVMVDSHAEPYYDRLREVDIEHMDLLDNVFLIQVSARVMDLRLAADLLCEMLGFRYNVGIDEADIIYAISADGDIPTEDQMRSLISNVRTDQTTVSRHSNLHALIRSVL